MALLIDTGVTERVLEMPAAVAAIESAFRQLGAGDAAFQPRTDVVSPTATDGDAFVWGSLLGAIRDPPRLAVRFKSDILSWVRRDGGVVEKKFNVEPGRFMGFVLLFDTSTGELLGLVNDGRLQHVRVGATAGVACAELAREDASRVGMLGSGGMARTYLEAFDVVRDLEYVTVYSPTATHRQSYAEEMRESLGLDVRPVEDPVTAVRDADIVAACTDARQPVLDYEWLTEGVLAEGAFVTNTTESETDDRIFENVDGVYTTTNDPYQPFTVGARDETGYYDHRGVKEKTDHHELAAVLADEVHGPVDSGEPIVYNNRSAGIQFAAVGDLVYERAVDRGLGTEIPLSWFQQDTRN